jgi:hypothetical protein
MFIPLSGVKMKSRNLTKPLDGPYLPKLEPITFEPVFIMGDHRSGTTLLYKVLSSSGYFNFINAYNIIKYDEILYNNINRIEQEALDRLQGEFDCLGIKTREIDEVQATPYLPEEYGFILSNAGYKSYLCKGNMPVFLEACRKVQYISNSSKPILLKNPWCLPYFLYIHQNFPGAKFIFIHRNPIHAINSKLRAVDQILSGWNDYIGLLSKQYNQIFRNPIYRLAYRTMYLKQFDIGVNRILKQSLETTSYFLENIKKIPRSSYISVRFEDLCDNPQDTLGNIFGFLHVVPDTPIGYSSLIQKRPVRLLEAVERNRLKIYKTLQPYFIFNQYQV